MNGPPHFSIAHEACGAFLASICAGFVCNPFEVAKVQLQLAKQTRDISMLKILVRQVKSQGVAGTMLGVTSLQGYFAAKHCVRLGPYMPVKSYLRKHLDTSNSKSSSKLGRESQKLLIDFVTAGVLGPFAAVTSNPFLLVKTRIQTPQGPYRYQGLWDGLHSIARAEGPFGHFRGVQAAIPRVSTGSVVQLVSYDFFKRQIVKNFKEDTEDGDFTTDWRVHLISSFLCGIAVVVFVAPWDCLSTRLYAKPGLTLVACFREIFHEGGIAAFYKGWLPFYLRIGPEAVVTMVVLEQSRVMLNGLSSLTTTVNLSAHDR